MSTKTNQATQTRKQIIVDSLNNLLKTSNAFSIEALTQKCNTNEYGEKFRLADISKFVNAYKSSKYNFTRTNNYLSFNGELPEKKKGKEVVVKLRKVKSLADALYNSAQKQHPGKADVLYTVEILGEKVISNKKGIETLANKLNLDLHFSEEKDCFIKLEEINIHYLKNIILKKTRELEASKNVDSLIEFYRSSYVVRYNKLRFEQELEERATEIFGKQGEYTEK